MLRRMGLPGIIVGAMLGFMAVEAGAQGVPPGSYLASCRDARDVAGWLKATCRDRSGRWIDATLAISWCAPGQDIANEDGRLVCKQAPAWSGSPSGGNGWNSPPPSPALNDRPPYGSYMATCRDVRMVAGWLKASCQDTRGRWVEATTSPGWCSAGRDIANIDGRLTCR